MESTGLSQTLDNGSVRVPVREIDLGPSRGVIHDRGADRWMVILPGAKYPPDAPLLWYAREVALAAGRNVLAVVDTFDRGDPAAWVIERAEAAIRHVGSTSRPLLVAKSLTSLATPIAARLELPAIWLTPLIAGAAASGAVVGGLAAATGPALLVGGTSDPAWDGDAARSLSKADVLEIPDADHALQVPGDVERSLDVLRTIMDRIADFIGREAGETSIGYRPTLARTSTEVDR